MPQCAETFVDVVGFLLPGARRTSPRPSATLAPREINHPQVGVLALRAHELDLSTPIQPKKSRKIQDWESVVLTDIQSISTDIPKLDHRRADKIR